MPRIKKQEAELKNRIIDSLLQILDGSLVLMLEDPEEYGEPDHVQNAVKVVRNALERRKSA
tara:strand:- start:11784 stop:11966 length:183 start_codon:yes stop_codon:yes gene_type:complete